MNGNINELNKEQIKKQKESKKEYNTSIIHSILPEDCNLNQFPMVHFLMFFFN